VSVVGYYHALVADKRHREALADRDAERRMDEMHRATEERLEREWAEDRAHFDRLREAGVL
jgi:hypothetical protein